MIWSPPKTHEVAVGDRVVQYCRYGEAGWAEADAVRVISLHGTPGTRWERPDIVAAINDAGLRVVVPGRPGYGSARRAGRSVADVADDVRAVADAEGWERFAVTGFSGGAPHALACAALLRERVTFRSTVAGIGPLELDWWADARKGEEHLRKHLSRRADELLAALGVRRRGVAGEGEGDDGGRSVRLRASLVDGIDGWIDDYLALVLPWGFDLGEIQAPVSVWYGTGDANSSIEHTRWLLANVPGATAHEYAGGHDPSDAVQREILAELSGDGRRGPRRTRG
ncbi:alpha/beta hydrolase [Kribbella sp. NPDC051770]|uniref:alpha/beta fold hydrolase n=1 Tax=Kribbella sp. NPDC051770 TaxID=3155413 RepID=UPI0034316C98